MSKKQISIEQIILFYHDFLAQQSDSSTSINNNSFRTAKNFKASGITTVLYSVRTRTGNASAGTPEFNAQRCRAAHN
jgi:hypothetical protein